MSVVDSHLQYIYQSVWSNVEAEVLGNNDNSTEIIIIIAIIDEENDSKLFLTLLLIPE